MEKDSKSYCKNCETLLSGKFCKNCGQRTSIGKITFKETFQDFVDMVFSVNAPLMLTLKMLVVNPGKLFREYLRGKRKTYYKPVAFFILTTIIYVLIKALLNYDPMENVTVAVDDKLDLSLFNDASLFMTRNINNIVFVFVFTFALSMKTFFYKRYSFTEYIAVSFYIIGIYLLITSIFTFYLKFANSEYKMMPFVIVLFYVLYAITSFFQKISLGKIIKTILVYLISVFFYWAIGYGISLFIVWLKTK